MYKQFLNRPPFSRVRRNHGLEHATIHVLSERYPNTTFIGRSDGKGFYIYGQVATDVLRAAVNEALTRLRNGEHSLAIHPVEVDRVFAFVDQDDVEGVTIRLGRRGQLIRRVPLQLWQRTVLWRHSWCKRSRRQRT